MLPDQWAGAKCGNPRDLRYVLEHNIEDVISTEELFKRVALFRKRANTSI